MDAEVHFQKLLTGTKGVQSGNQSNQKSKNMAPTPSKELQLEGQIVTEEDNNDEFEDAPEGDDASFASSSGSQIITPRSGAEGTESNSERGPLPDV
jgi:hypothetical protein